MPDPMQSELEPSDEMGDAEAVPESAPASSAYTICIAVTGDGSFSVYEEPLDTDRPTGPADQEPITNFEDALRAALRLYKTKPGDRSAQDDFETGYSRV